MAHETEETLTLRSPLTQAEILALSLRFAAVYVTGAIYTTTAVGVKLTFVESIPEGLVEPRVSVLLPVDTIEKLIEGLTETLRRIQTAAQPEKTSSTLQ